MSPDDAAFLAAFDRLPRGVFAARWRGRRWLAVRRAYAGGRAEKLVAEAPGGPGAVSMNLYRLRGGFRLAPCEMPEAEARAFVLGAMPEGQ